MYVIVLCEYLVYVFSTGSVLVSVVWFTIAANHNVWLFVSSTGVVQSVVYCYFVFYVVIFYYVCVNILQQYEFLCTIMNGMLTVPHEDQGFRVRRSKQSMAIWSAGSRFTSSALPRLGCDPEGSIQVLFYSNRIFKLVTRWKKIHKCAWG
jgi:hypothetical protein